MTRLTSLLLAGAAPLFLATAAAAADAPGTAPWAEQLIPQEVSTGWYLRGDIAYDLQATPGGHTARGAFAGARIADGWVAGAGFGYKFSEWFRWDVTGDVREGRRLSASRPYRENGEIEASTLLANVYLDLPFHDWITPYVGVGVGAAYVSLGSHHTLRGRRDDRYAGATDWTFAWALMGGVAAEVAPSVSIDIGYRYLALSEVGTGPGLSRPRRSDIGSATYSDLAAHELRAGLRWVVD